MDTQIHTLRPQQNIAEAVSAFQKASESEGKKIFGMMVTNDEDRLVGMLSMYDVLIYVQPKYVAILGEIEDLDPAQAYRNRLKTIRLKTHWRSWKPLSYTDCMSQAQTGRKLMYIDC